MANGKDTELDVFTGERGEEGEDMQTIPPGEFKEALVKYNQVHLPIEKRSDFLGF